MEQLIEDFLAQRRIAVAGVSRSGESAGNPILKKLEAAGHEVFAVNPQATEIDGRTCYARLADIPGGVDAVVIATHPNVSASVVADCAALGISRVWLHRSFGTGSVADEAVEACRRAGIDVIAGACPMMFCAPVDFGHRCMRWLLKVGGRLPKPQADPSREMHTA